MGIGKAFKIEGKCDFRLQKLDWTIYSRIMSGSDTVVSWSLNRAVSLADLKDKKFRQDVDTTSDSLQQVQ